MPNRSGTGHISAFHILLLAGVLLAGCTAQLATGPPPGPGTYICNPGFTTGGFQRSYRLHVPQGYNDGRTYPLVIALHGAFKTAARFEKETGLSQIADRDGFVVAYPDGIGIFGLLQHWNAGFCCGKAARDDIDDIGFIVRVIRDAGQRLTMDFQDVYLVGFSNGGMLAYRFGAENPDMVSAIAVLGGAIGALPTLDAPSNQIRPPGQAVPLLIFHGRDDPLIPYTGGGAIGRNSPPEYLSVADAARFWAENNRCGPSPAVRRLAGGALTEERWPCPDPRSDVVLYSIGGWGHRWPGGAATQGLDATAPLKGFDAAEIILEFFKRHPRR